VQLVPFGEFVPFRDKLPMLQNYGVRAEDVLAAKKHVLLNTCIGRTGTNICFESLFPEIARGETLHGAELLCVVTNDAWFQRTQAAHQHLMMAQLRAVENRRYLARAAGTGISALIDPYGRIKKQIGLFTPSTIMANVQPHTELTIYTRFGQWFAYLCVLMLIVCLPLLLRGSCEALADETRPQETEPATARPQNPR
jgi:apolipoprotein N-acyltransferase